MKHRLVSLVQVLALAAPIAAFVAIPACGGDDDNNDEPDAAEQQPDAEVPDAAPDAEPAEDLSCIALNTAIGTPAADSLTLSGRVVSKLTGGPVKDATVGPVGFIAADLVTEVPVGTPKLTPDNGTYSFTVPTNALGSRMPVFGYMKYSLTNAGSGAQQIPTIFAMVPQPLVADFALADVPQINVGLAGLVVDKFDGVATPATPSPTQDPANGLVLASVVDCNGKPVEGATVTVVAGSGANTAVGYLTTSNGGLEVNTTATSVDGVAVIINVPPGKFVLKASKGGKDFMLTAAKAYTDKGTFGITSTRILPDYSAINK